MAIQETPYPFYGFDDGVPDAIRELTRFQALDGKTWTPPSLAGSLLVVRNDRETAAYGLPVE